MHSASVFVTRKRREQERDWRSQGEGGCEGVERSWQNALECLRWRGDALNMRKGEEKGGGEERRKGRERGGINEKRMAEK